MDLDALFNRIIETVNEQAYFTPVVQVDSRQRAAMALIQESMAKSPFDVDRTRRLIARLADEGHIDRVMTLSALHVVACHPNVKEYAEAARLVGEQEFAALELGGANLQANLASVDRHRGVLAFLNGHHEVALEHFTRALERQRTSENVQNILCTMCAMGEADEAMSVLQMVRRSFSTDLVRGLEAAIAQDPDLALLREERDYDLH